MLELRAVSTRQCAWCLRVVDDAGVYALQAGRKIRSATHGICPSCKDMVRSEIEGSTSDVLVRAA